MRVERYLRFVKTEASKIKYKIPKEGSLALLALGAQGIRAWREVRDAANQSDQTTHQNE